MTTDRSPYCRTTDLDLHCVVIFRKSLVFLGIGLMDGNAFKQKPSSTSSLQRFALLKSALVALFSLMISFAYLLCIDFNFSWQKFSWNVAFKK